MREKKGGVCESLRRKKGRKDEKEKVKIGLGAYFERACESACMRDLTVGCVFYFF